MTASPAGDLLPVLLVTDARARGRRPARRRGRSRRTRSGPATAQTALAARRAPGGRPDPAGARAPGPVPQGRHASGAGDREGVVAVAWRTGDAPGRDAGAAPGTTSGSALGSVAERPIRAPRTEAVLEGRVPGPAVAAEAAAAVEAEITPIDDIRSTAAYRRAVTGRVLRRIVLDAADRLTRLAVHLSTTVRSPMRRPVATSGPRPAPGDAQAAAHAGRHVEDRQLVHHGDRVVGARHLAESAAVARNLQTTGFPADQAAGTRRAIPRTSATAAYPCSSSQASGSARSSRRPRSMEDRGRAHLDGRRAGHQAARPRRSRG